MLWNQNSTLIMIFRTVYLVLRLERVNTLDQTYLPGETITFNTVLLEVRDRSLNIEEGGPREKWKSSINFCATPLCSIFFAPLPNVPPNTKQADLISIFKYNQTNFT